MFVATRLFPTELTSKPESEKETTKIYEKDSLSRSLKIRWLAEFEIDVRSKVTCMHKSTCAEKSEARAYITPTCRQVSADSVLQEAWLECEVCIVESSRCIRVAPNLLTCARSVCIGEAIFFLQNAGQIGLAFRDQNLANFNMLILLTKQRVWNRSPAYAGARDHRPICDRRPYRCLVPPQARQWRCNQVHVYLHDEDTHRNQCCHSATSRLFTCYLNIS